MSDLIEQLGGYEKAKKIWDLRPEPNDSGYIKYYSLSENQFFDEYAYEWCQIKKDWYETMKSTNNLNLISVRDLGLELLQYRRQNNLITLGDWIFIEEYKPELQMHQITKDDIGSHWIKLVEFRHATDEEIEQVNKGGGLNDSTSSDHT